MTAGTVHQASIVIACAAEEAFAFLSNPANLNRWSFGTWQTDLRPDGLVLGTSLFDGSRILVRIDQDLRRLLIDFHLGQDPDSLVPRISARIVPGPVLGLGSETSVLSLLAWRSAGMDDDRWRRLIASHELEVVLLKSLLENRPLPPSS